MKILFFLVGTAGYIFAINVAAAATVSPADAVSWATTTTIVAEKDRENGPGQDVPPDPPPPDRK